MTLLVVFPLRAHKVVGTDIFHAAILLYVAGAAHWAAGNVDFGILFWLLLGSIPGVLIGGRLTLSIPEQRLRLLLAGVLGLAGIKLLDVPFAGTIVVVVLSAGAVALLVWLARHSWIRFVRGRGSGAAAPIPASSSSVASRGDAHGLGELRHDRPRLPGGGCGRRRGDRRSRDAARADRSEPVGAVLLRRASRRGSAPTCTRRATSTRTRPWRVVRALEPELIFVVGWSQLVRDPFIALASEGVFGMHPTLLPRHRGRAPIPWAILTGLARTGVTLFEIVDATADSGSIVGQVTLDIAPDETATTLFARIADAHVELTRELVPQLLARTAPRIPQDPSRASSWPKRTPADGIIDWETRAPYLYDWVRAQTRPYPGAFTFLGDEKVIVWGARPVELGRDARRRDDRRDLTVQGPWSRAARAVSCSRRSRRRPAELVVGARLG